MAASTDSGIAEGSADPKHDSQEIDREPGGQEIHADANNHWIAAEDGRPVASAREKGARPCEPSEYARESAQIAKRGWESRIR